MTTKDEHFLQHALIAVFMIAVLAIFGMVMLVYQTPDRQIILPGETANTAGFATATCTLDRTCFNGCIETLSSRTDIPITQTCSTECCT